ncbi:MAG: GMP synthase subunit B [Firmicutes bacterium ADurb.Bin419]|nr:MAG: GMP synthase subunit B [Firmicutes bacterium ADurb.Bin419]
MCAASKLGALREELIAMQSVVIAFSGGVDSTFLLKMAHEVLGDRVLAVTASSATFPEREFKEAVNFAAEYGIPHRVIQSEELEIEGFSDNPLNRCYLCKKELFMKMKQLADSEGFKFVAEGSNYDDLGDYRPGMQAISELGIVSPLRDAGLTKAEIRQHSKEMGLKTWDKPSFACLSSRFPYGEKITAQKLQMVDKAEQFLIDMGFKQVRVRHHGSLARIEVDDLDFDKFIDKETRNAIYLRLKELGFIHVSLDLKGYRTGSMNEGLIK